MKVKVAILTSDHFRHKYFVNTVAKTHEVVGVVAEEKSFQPAKYAENEQDEAIIRNHFHLRDIEEKKAFDAEFNSAIDVLSLPPKSVNAQKVLNYLLHKNPDYLFVYGTGIIGREVIEAFNGRIINMHLGLSPYYRGAGTNFYPIVNGEPEYCGVTIHFLDAGIDSGDIISRGKAVINENDNPHTLGCRIIKVGIKLIIESVEKIKQSSFTPEKQNLSIGKVYYRKDFDAQKVLTAYNNIEKGLFRDYVHKQYAVLKEVLVYEI
mgnify:CR=1 FL=1|jgi:methionyl-tRNA formyltransferase